MSTYTARQRRKEIDPKFRIEDKEVLFCFPTEYDKNIAEELLKRERYFLFALSIDYPGLYGIPMCYYEAVRREFKEMGFKHGYAKKLGDKSLRFKLFCLGPRRRGHFGSVRGETNREDAWGFKVFWLNTEGWLTTRKR